MFATLVGKSCWRHSGQRAEGRHASWNPENSLTTGIGTFPSALLAGSPVLPWPSVPKKHFEIKNTDHHSLRIRLHRAAVTEASEKQGEGGRRPIKKSLCQVEPVSLRGKMFWQREPVKVNMDVCMNGAVLQCFKKVKTYKISRFF